MAGKTLFHPQCHFGQDTLSWARHGASVTGPRLLRARGRGGSFARGACRHRRPTSCAPTCTTHRPRSDGRTFDVVYTGLGAINWLDDIDRWAAVMASVCRPGGTFYLAEFHPVVDMLSPTVHEDGVLPITLQQNYFGTALARWRGGHGHLRRPLRRHRHNETWERVWTIGEVVTAIAQAGVPDRAPPRAPLRAVPDVPVPRGPTRRHLPHARGAAVDADDVLDPGSSRPLSGRPTHWNRAGVTSGRGRRWGFVGWSVRSR